MIEVMAILIIGLMWCGFFLSKNYSAVKKNEFYVYVTALAAVIVMTGYYYSVYQALWCGFSVLTGVAFGLGFRHYVANR